MLLDYRWEIFFLLQAFERSALMSDKIDYLTAIALIYDLNVITDDLDWWNLMSIK